MTLDGLLIGGVVVFAVMLVGLVLTVIEFRSMK